MAKTSAETRSEARRERVSAERRVNEHQSGGTNYLRIPPGMHQIEISGTGVRRFDVIPYVCGKGNPFAEAGKTYFERTFWIYQGIGAANEKYIVPSKTWGLPDPIAEDIIEHRRQLSALPRTDANKAARDAIIALLKNLGEKERQLWLINDLDEPKKGVQLWDYSYHLFGKQLDARIQAAKTYNDTFKYFADLAEGFTIMVAFAEKSIEGGKAFYEASSIDFVPRAQPYPEDFHKKQPVLDDMLVKVPYDRLRCTYLQIPMDDGEAAAPPDEAPAKATAQVTAPAAAETGDVITAAERGITVTGTVKYGADICTVLKISPDGTLLTLEKADGDLVSKVPVADVKVPKGNKPAAEAPAAAPTPVTAAMLGIDAGDTVTYKGALYDVLKVSKDGLQLTLEDAAGELVPKVPPGECKKAEKAPAEAVGNDDFDSEPAPAAAPAAQPKAAAKKEKAAAPAAAPAPGADDNWDDWED